MNVGMVLWNYFPHDVHVETEADSLRAAGHDVSLLCLGEADHPTRETVEGVEVHRVYPWGRAIDAFATEADADALHVHDLPLVDTALWVGERRDLPVVVLPEPTGDDGAAGEVGVDPVVDGGVDGPAVSERGAPEQPEERGLPVVIEVVEPARRGVTVVDVEGIVGRDHRTAGGAGGEHHVRVAVAAPVDVLPDAVLERPGQPRQSAPEPHERSVATSQNETSWPSRTDAGGVPTV